MRNQPAQSNREGLSATSFVSRLRRSKPWDLALMVGVFVLGVACALVGHFGMHSTPRRTFERWVAVVAQGDVATLRTDARLGNQEWIESTIRTLGFAEYNRVIAIYGERDRLGLMALSRLRADSASRGEGQFNELPAAERTAIDRRSREEWTAERGYAMVPAAAAAGSWQGLFRDPPTQALIAQLGSGTLTAEEQTLLGNRFESDPQVVADPMLADLARKRSAAGWQALDALRAQVRREGEREFQRLRYSEREEINRRSHQEFVVSRGFAALSPQDQRVLGTAAALNAGGLPVIHALGAARLPPGALALLQGLTREQFVAQRERYIATVGARLARQQLLERFARATPEIEQEEVLGVGGRDLVRRGTGKLEVAWRGLGGREGGDRSIVRLRWSSKSAEWRITQIEWSASRESREGASGSEPDDNAHSREDADDPRSDSLESNDGGTL